MRSPLAFLAVAGLACSMVVAGLAGQPAGTPAAAPTAQPPAEPAPPPTYVIPVPDGPVIGKQELEGGLILEDIKIGDGYEVKPLGAVVAHYHGTLGADPTKVFQSSYQTGEPVPFALSGVVEGWTKGVPGMKVGGVRRLTIPAKLAWGERSPGPEIPPNSDVVFIIQIVDALQVEDIKEGTGEPASSQCVAATTYVMKDADGKEIEKSDPAAPYIWIPGEFQGMQFGLEGMKVGGKRKLIVPKEMNVTNPGVPAPTARPANVPLTIEVELVALRNLPQRRR